MKNTNFAKSHLLTDEVDVDLDVLGTTVVDRVGCHVDSADIIAVDDCSNLQRNMEFLKKLPQPATLGDDVSNRPVLGPGLTKPVGTDPVWSGPVSIWADTKPVQIQNSNLNSKK